jgi:hypothetical protein
MNAKAVVGWSVNIDDPFNEYTSLHSAIEANFFAAANAWGSHIVGSGTIDVNISFANIGTADGGSAATQFDHMSADGHYVYQQGAAYEAITGIDPNGSTADINIRLGRDWMNNVLWWDPNPTLRTDAIPDFHVDGESTLMHEIGHGLAFNGWRNGTTGALPGDYESPFDENVVAGGGYLWFSGAHAEAAYGGPVPLTLGNYGHYGNLGGPGSEFVGVGLMNGVYSYYQTRWNVSAVDLGILQDTGFTLVSSVPEPTTFAVMSLGVAALLRRRKR